MTSPRTSTKSKRPVTRKATGAQGTQRISAAPAKKSPKKSARASQAPAQSPVRKASAKTSGAPATPAAQTSPATQARVLACYKELVRAHPDAHCELDHKNPFELIVATALSAQSTDVQVNKVTPGLFAAYPTPQALSAAGQEQVEALINRLGMFRQKAKNLIGMAQALVRDHNGQVPADLPALVKLPGVGRKTANVVLGVAFAAPVGVVVDTHVQRITQRLGWTLHQDPIKIEQDLLRLLPPSEWDRVSHTLIFHGRRVCFARRPACSTCPVNELCASAFVAETVGRKPTRVR